MKKLVFALAALAVLSITACHYGQEEAKKTLERNDLYKSDKADYSVNRAGEGGKPEKPAATEAPKTAAVDTTAKAAPAAETHEHAH